jgi:hypothetical protein
LLLQVPQTPLRQPVHTVIKGQMHIAEKHMWSLAHVLVPSNEHQVLLSSVCVRRAFCLSGVLFAFLAEESAFWLLLFAEAG